MELSQAIGGRRTVREYRPQQVGEETIRRLIGRGAGPKRGQRAAVDVHCRARSGHPGSALARSESAHARDDARGPSFGALRLPARRSEIFYHAPVLIVISAAAQGPWIVEDCALAAENLMLAAYGEGLGSGWIGFAQSYLNMQAGKDLLGLALDCVPVAPIIIGYPKSTPPPVPRKAPVIRWVAQD